MFCFDSLAYTKSSAMDNGIKGGNFGDQYRYFEIVLKM